jgi:RNA polymerase sigma factor (sigma-70 family)
MEFDEREWVERAKDGDRKAFDNLIRRNKDKMFSLAYRMTGERETALDLMQETFFTAFKSLAGYRGDSTFSSWLYRIAANKSVNYLRRKKIISFLPLSQMGSEEPSYQMSNDLERAEVNRAMVKAIAGLPPKQKLIFNLRFYEQMPFGQIAEILNKSESTIKTGYQKAIEKLRKQMIDFR